MNILTRYSDTVAIGDSSDEILCPSTRQLMLPLAGQLWLASMMTLLRFFTPSLEPDRAGHSVAVVVYCQTLLCCNCVGLCLLSYYAQLSCMSLLWPHSRSNDILTLLINDYCT